MGKSAAKSGGRSTKAAKVSLNNRLLYRAVRDPARVPRDPSLGHDESSIHANENVRSCSSSTGMHSIVNISLIEEDPEHPWENKGNATLREIFVPMTNVSNFMEIYIHMEKQKQAHSL